MIAYYIFFSVIGAALGSFASFLVYRFTHDEPVAKTASVPENLSPHRSKCTSCRRTLYVRDLIPIFSWFLLKGRCRFCRAPISVFYPLTEIFCAVFSSVAIYWFGLNTQAYIILAALPVLYALFFVDLKTMRLPDPLMFCFAALGGGVCLLRFIDGVSFFQIFEKYLLGALIYGVLAYALARLVELILKKPALGFGDIKFFAVSGLWLGVDLLPDFLILSGVFGVVLGSIWRFILFKGNDQSVFPFGPALIVSFLTLLFYHDGVVNLILP
jgi:leader peptidase (prepilin peptidase)/N-methyltransferase